MVDTLEGSRAASVVGLRLKDLSEVSASVGQDAVTSPWRAWESSSLPNIPLGSAGKQRPRLAQRVDVSIRDQHSQNLFLSVGLFELRDGAPHLATK